MIRSPSSEASPSACLHGGQTPNAPRMPALSATHLVLIPSFNSGIKLEQTVRDALQAWAPVWVVVDGSTDGSDRVLEPLVTEYPDHFRLLRQPTNTGKGSAILAGLREAIRAGFTHVLTMDADGQHDPQSLARFMEVSAQNPDALVLGLPQFDASAPSERLFGHQIANFFARLQTLGGNIGDCLFGFRVYPATALLSVLESTRFARRYDFDPEVAIRLVWRGHPAHNLPTSCRYFKASEGGISHFKYFRDNILLIWMYARLLIGFFLRLPLLILRRLTTK
jgi:glycosyltransferase involved in cell wall biosynthesis